MERKRFLGLTQNQLKVIGAISMLIDHVGVELLPQFSFLRIIGRLAFPIFSFFIYEGCRYAHNKLKYFLQLFGLGILCMAGYYIYCGEIYGDVLITFSLSVCLIYSIQFLKKKISGGVKDMLWRIVLVILCTGMIWEVCRTIVVDYGFVGVILPAFAEIFDGKLFKQNSVNRSSSGGNSFNQGLSAQNLSDVDSRHSDLYMGKILPLLGFGIGLVLLSVQLGEIQYYSLVSLLLLALYNGSRGKANMKNFFYWFYPVHLLIIGGISMLL